MRHSRTGQGLGQVKVNWGKRRKPYCNLGCAGKAGQSRGKGPARQSSPLPNPALGWLWFPEAGGALASREGRGGGAAAALGRRRQAFLL